MMLLKRRTGSSKYIAQLLSHKGGPFRCFCSCMAYGAWNFVVNSREKLPAPFDRHSKNSIRDSNLGAEFHGNAHALTVFRESEIMTAT